MNMSVDKYANRKYLYIFKSVHGSTCVVNYDATNNALNSFLHLFDVWGSNGHFKMSADNNLQEVWFECTKEFMEMSKTDTIQQAFNRLGVKVVYEYPFDDIA